MSEGVRDDQYVEQVITDIKQRKKDAELYLKNNADYVAQFAHDAKLQALLPYLAFGQEEAERRYDEMAEKIDLTKGQHPHYAVSGPSAAGGNCVHVLGEEGLKMGNVLVLRQPDSSVRYRDGSLTHSADSFYALAKWKELPAAIHIKSAGNKFIEAAYFANKYGDLDLYDYALAQKSDEAMRKFIRDPYVRDYIKNTKELYEEVLKNGFEHYENLLVVDDEDREIIAEAFERSKEDGHQETIDSRYIRAMEIQEAVWDHKTIVDSGFVPDNVLVVFQGRITNRQFLWNPELKRFISIPDLEPDNQDYDRQKKRFLTRLPYRETWRKAGKLMMDGARYYRRLLALETAMEGMDLDFRNPDVISCSDSRSLPKFIIFTGADHLRVAFRNPGTFVSRNKKMMSDAGRFFAHAELRNKSIILAPHANCGAETAIDAFFEGAEIPTAFATLAEHRQRLVRTVLNKGREPDEATPIDTFKGLHSKEDIVAHYTKLTSIPLKTVADCLSVQQLLWDFDVAKKEFGNVHLVCLYQNMNECQNYVLNTKTMKFVEIKPANEVRLRPERTRNTDCACCGAGHGGISKTPKQP